MGHDILSIGELLVDLIAAKPGSMSAPGEFLFSREAGGAPANVAAASARLLGPGRAGFVGRVGDDPFGRYLRNTLDSFGVDTSSLVVSSEVQTPVAIVGRPEGSQEIEFSFYGPDQGKRLALIAPEDLSETALRESKIVVAGGVALSHPISTESIRRAALYVTQAECLFAFDPNWRSTLWLGVDAWKGAVWSLLPSVDVLKISRSELVLLSGMGDVLDGGSILAQVASRQRDPDRALLIAVTHGAYGAGYVLFSGPGDGPRLLGQGHVDPVPVEAIDPTGAGDAFLAGLLVGLLEASGGAGSSAMLSLAELSQGQLLSALSFGNATGALATTIRGAMSGLPSRSAVEELLHSSGDSAGGQPQH